VQQVSAITRKRLASKAVERLEESKGLVKALQDDIAALQQHSAQADSAVEVEQQNSQQLQEQLQAHKREKQALEERVSDLEKEVTTFDIRCHDLTRKVRSCNCMLRLSQYMLCL
jgi:chromosome segregation ATPase